MVRSLITRNELKVIKKDIAEQIKSGVASDELYIKNWITYGDNIYEGNNSSFKLDGKLTAKEIKSHMQEECTYKVYKMDDIIIAIDEDNSINFEVRAILIDEYDNMTDWEFVKLNI